MPCPRRRSETTGVSADDVSRDDKEARVHPVRALGRRRAASLLSGFEVAPSGLAVPRRAGIEAPSPVRLFLTATEVLGRPIAQSVLDGALHATLAEDFIAAAAQLLFEYERHRWVDDETEVEFEERMAAQFFGGEVLARVRRLVRRGYVVLAPQVLLGVMKAALLVSPPGAGRGSVPSNDLTTVMLGIAERLGAIAGDGRSTPAFEDIVVELARNQAFNRSHYVGSAPGREYRLWWQLPRELGSGALDLHAEFRAATGAELDDVFGLGMLVWSGVNTHRSVRAPRDYLDGMPIPRERLEAAMAVVVSDAAALRATVEGETLAAGFDWSYNAFRRKPVLATADGSLIVLSSGMLMERCLGGAAYWEVLDHRGGGGGDPARTALRQLHADAVEAYVGEILRSIAATATPGVRMYTEREMRAAWGDRAKVCDYAMDFGTTWLCVEVVSGRLTSASLSSGTPEDFERDVEKLVGKKSRQLDSTVKQLRVWEAALTGTPPPAHRRYVPAVAAGHGFPVNFVTRAEIVRRIAAEGLFTGADTAPVEVLDLQELEALEALHEEGGPSPDDVLWNKQWGRLKDATVEQHVALELGLKLDRPQRVRDLTDTAFDEALRHLGGAP